jgi:hypothetical protein
MSDILKLCRCGGIPTVMMFNRPYQTDQISGTSTAYYIECQSCGKITNDNYSKFEAICEWNDLNE